MQKITNPKSTKLLKLLTTFTIIMFLTGVGISAQFDIEDVNPLDDDVAEGEILEVELTVYNSGDEGTDTVELHVFGEKQDSIEIDLDEDDEETVNLSYDSGVGDATRLKITGSTSWDKSEELANLAPVFEYDEGMNLVSFPSKQGTYDPGELLEDAENVESLWSYEDGQWKSYSTAEGHQSDLQSVEGGKGYVMFASDDGVFSADVVQADEAMYPSGVSMDKDRWNLVGHYYMSIEETPVAAGLEHVEQILELDGNEFVPADSMRPGKGYYVDTSEDFNYVADFEKGWLEIIDFNAPSEYEQGEEVDIQAELQNTAGGSMTDYVNFRVLDINGNEVIKEEYREVDFEGDETGWESFEFDSGDYPETGDFYVIVATSADHQVDYVTVEQVLDSFSVEESEFARGEPFEIEIKDAMDKAGLVYNGSVDIEITTQDIEGYDEPTKLEDVVLENGEAEVEVLNETENLVDGDYMLEATIDEITENFEVSVAKHPSEILDDFSVEDLSIEQGDELRIDFSNATDLEGENFEGKVDMKVMTSELEGFESDTTLNQVDFSEDNGEAGEALDESVRKDTTGLSGQVRDIDVEAENDVHDANDTFELTVEQVLEDFEVEDSTIMQGENLYVNLTDAKDMAGENFSETSYIEFSTDDLEGHENDRAINVDFSEEGRAEYVDLEIDAPEELKGQETELKAEHGDIERYFFVTVEQVLENFDVKDVSIDVDQPLEIEAENATDITGEVYDSETDYLLEVTTGDLQGFEEDNNVSIVFEDGESELKELMNDTETDYLSAQVESLTGEIKSDRVLEGHVETDFEVNITAGTPEDISVEPEHDSATADGEETLEYTVEVTDVAGNPVSDVEVEIDDNGTDVSYDETIETGEDGEAVLQASSTVSQQNVEFDFEEQINDNYVNATGTFEPGTPNSIKVQKEPDGTQTAGEVITGEPDVLVTDEHDNPVPEVEVQVEAGWDGGPITDGNTTVETDEKGISIFDDLVIENAGRHLLYFFNDEYDIGDSSGQDKAHKASTSTFEVKPNEGFEVNIESQPVDTSVGEFLEGEDDHPVASVSDRYGNLVPNVTVNVTAEKEGLEHEFEAGTVSRKTEGEGIAEDEMDGKAEFDDLNITEMGDYKLNFSIFEEEENTERDHTVESQEFEITPGEPAEFEIEDIEDKTAGENFEIDISAYDRFGNLATGFDETAELEDHTGTIDPEETGEFTEGEWTGEVNMTEAVDANNITVYLEEDEDVNGTSNDFEVSHADPEVFEFTEVEDQTAGEEFEVSVFALDEFDNNATSYEGEADISSEKVDIEEPGELEFTEGTWEGHVNITDDEEEVVLVAEDTDEDPDVYGESNEFNVDTNLATVVDVYRNPEDTVAGEYIENQPAAEVNDSFDNRVDGVEVTVEAGEGDGDIETGETVVDTEEGIASFEDLVIEKADRYRLKFSIDEADDEVGREDTETTASFDVVPADADDFEVNFDSDEIDAGETPEIYVNNTEDEFGNNVNNTREGEVEVKDEDDTVVYNNDSAVFEFDEGDAVYTPDKSFETSGEYTAEVKVDDETRDGEFEVRPIDADSVGILTEPEDSTAGEEIQGPPEVNTTDEFGNLVDGVEVEVEAIDGSGELTDGSTTSVDTDGGTATFDDLVIEEADTYELEFSINEGHENVSDSVDETSETFEVNPAELNSYETEADDIEAGDHLEIEITDGEDEFVNSVNYEYDGSSVVIQNDTEHEVYRNDSAVFDFDQGETDYLTDENITDSGDHDVTVNISGIEETEGFDVGGDD